MCYNKINIVIGTIGRFMERIKLYTNTAVQKTLENMRDSKRLPHSFLITGKQGSGKKTFAKFLAQMILCEHPDIAPCGECNACHKVAEGEHPDLVYAEHSGKLGGFSADFLRDEIIAKAYIKPNDGDYRVYIFADCNNFLQRTQNTLLKLIEEPPRHAKFIFTATSENVFLPTILSRTTHLELFEATRDECLAALKDNGADDETAAAALEACGNDIGKCFEYINGAGEESEAVTVAAKQVVLALLSKNEYQLNAALFKVSGDRATMLDTLDYISTILRDGAAISENENLTALSGNKALAKQIAGKFSTERIVKIRQILCDCMDAVSKNCSRPLMSAAASAKISELF